MKEQTADTAVYEIDLLRLLKVLWKNLIVIIIAAVLLAGIGFSYARFIIVPKYQASALMYVNNKSISLGSTSVSFSTGELSAAKSLVDTYSVILKTRKTLNTVIRNTGVNYTYDQLSKMVSASSVNNTEIFAITVTSTDPNEAEMLANTLADLLPEKISDIVEGSNVTIVDRAVVPTKRVSPSYTRYTAIGFVLGLVLSAAAVILLDLFDDIIRSDDYLLQNFDLPVLGTIPDLSAQSVEKSGYGARVRRN